MNKKNTKIVNKPAAKVDGMSLALGKPLFTADLVPHNSLIVKVLWSPHAHANIADIDITEAEKMPGVHCVLCHTNVPRIPHVTGLTTFPENFPKDCYLFDRKVRHVGDRVAAVAAETVEQAEEALKKIRVQYEVLEPVLNLDDAMKEGTPPIHDEKDTFCLIENGFQPDKNIIASLDVQDGDIEAAFKESEYIMEHQFETQQIQHAFMENYTSFAVVDSYNRVVITSAQQCTYHCRRQVARTLDIPISRVRVIKPRLGGGFGGKQDMVAEDIVGMFALRTGRPCFLEFTREETFKAGRTKHPIRMNYKMGVKSDGCIAGLNMDLKLNAGSYASFSPAVCVVAASHALTSYKFDNFKFTGTSYYVNVPVSGAFRGYGATQANFGFEQMIDMAAEKVGMNPLEYRKKHHIDAMTGHSVYRALCFQKPDGSDENIGSCMLDDCFEKGSKAIGWNEKWAAPSTKSGRFRRGLGVAVSQACSGIARIDMGSAFIKMNEDGSFNLNIGASDCGQGSDTVLCQIAAETIGTTPDRIIVLASDTDTTPYDAGAYASKTTFVSGSAVKKTAEKVRFQILEHASKMLKDEVEHLIIENSKVTSNLSGDFVTFEDIGMDSLQMHDQHQIGALESFCPDFAPPPFATSFVEVEVDMYSGKVEVIKMVQAVDCGNPINPQLAMGQAEGGSVMAMSYALDEEYRFDNKGAMTNASFITYAIPGIKDIPDVECILVEGYEDSGPYGAKSIGEVINNGMVPAIANAIYNATGSRLYKMPFTQENVWNAIKDRVKPFEKVKLDKQYTDYQETSRIKSNETRWQRFMDASENRKFRY